MKFLDFLIYLLFWAAFGSAQSSALISSCAVGSTRNSTVCSIADALKLACLGQTLPASGCALADSTCQCTSRNLTVSTAECMLANCTMAETLGMRPNLLHMIFLIQEALSKFQADLCKSPFRNRSQLIVSVFVAITAVATVFVAARFVSGTLWGYKLGLEDWIVAAALVSVNVIYPALADGFRHLPFLPSPLPSKVCCSPTNDALQLTIAVASEGFGKHLYSLGDGDLLKFLRDCTSSFQNLRANLTASVYIAENIYVVVLAVTKLSILAFYLRIFQNQYWFRLEVWLTIGLICLSTAIISILTIIQCHPIEFFWNRDIKSGACLDVNALAYANSAMSMSQDIIIIILPIPVVLKLNMNKQKKIGIALMFALGGL